MNTIDAAKRLLPLLLLCLGLASCQTTSVTYEEYHAQQSALEKAQEAGTVAAYEAFLDAYPHSPWKSHAVYYRDEAAFNEAEKIGSEEAYKEFMRKYPWSKWRKPARYSMVYETE